MSERKEQALKRIAEEIEKFRRIRRMFVPRSKYKTIRFVFGTILNYEKEFLSKHDEYDDVVAQLVGMVTNLREQLSGVVSDAVALQLKECLKTSKEINKIASTGNLEHAWAKRRDVVDCLQSIVDRAKVNMDKLGKHAEVYYKLLVALGYTRRILKSRGIDKHDQLLKDTIEELLLYMGAFLLLDLEKAGLLIKDAEP